MLPEIKKSAYKNYGYFDHVINDRIYHISQGDKYWAVNDVTKARASNLGAAKAAKLSRWVAFCNSPEAAIKAAELDSA